METADTPEEPNEIVSVRERHKHKGREPQAWMYKVTPGCGTQSRVRLQRPVKPEIKRAVTWKSLSYTCLHLNLLFMNNNSVYTALPLGRLIP